MCYNLRISMNIQQLQFFLIKRLEWLKECSTKLSQSIPTWNYVLYTVSYQKTLLKPENPTQGHMTNLHKDVRDATKTSSYATKTSIMPRRHQLCHKDINYTTKTLVMPRRHQSATRMGCQDTNVTKTMISSWVITE